MRSMFDQLDVDRMVLLWMPLLLSLFFVFLSVLQKPPDGSSRPQAKATGDDTFVGGWPTTREWTFVLRVFLAFVVCSLLLPFVAGSVFLAMEHARGTHVTWARLHAWRHPLARSTSSIVILLISGLIIPFVLLRSGHRTRQIGVLACLGAFFLAAVAYQIDQFRFPV